MPGGPPGGTADPRTRTYLPRTTTYNSWQQGSSRLTASGMPLTGLATTRIGSRPDNIARFDVEKWGSTHPGLNRAPGLAQAAADRMPWVLCDQDGDPAPRGDTYPRHPGRVLRRYCSPASGRARRSAAGGGGGRCGYHDLDHTGACPFEHGTTGDPSSVPADAGAEQGWQVLRPGEEPAKGWDAPHRPAGGDP